MGCQMKQLRTIVIFTIIFIMFLLPINTILAADIDTTDYNPDNITTNSPSVILMDAKTGKILYSKNALSFVKDVGTTAFEKTKEKLNSWYQNFKNN